MSWLSRVTRGQVAMAAYGLKFTWALVMFNVITRVMSSGYCPWRTCGFNGVEIRYPFILDDDALRCYTAYPNLQFSCLNELLHVNFTTDTSYSSDRYIVTKINYWN